MNCPTQVGGGETAGVLDQLTGGVHFAEQIAHHGAAHAAVVEIVDDASLVFFLPVGKGVESAVDVADGLVAELEQVREEERHVSEWFASPGHVAAGVLALAEGIVPMLEPAWAETGLREERDVAGRVDVLRGCL